MKVKDDYGGRLAGAQVLVIDDEPGMRNFLVKILQPRVKHVAAAGSAAEASKVLDEAHFDLVILDNIMPGATGLDWVTEQQRKGFFADTILITAYADLETAIAALRAGVSDFVLKPFRANHILGAIARTLDRTHLRRDNVLLRRELHAGAGQGKLLGASLALIAVRDLLAKLAPLPTPVLFTGESGTGKELAARRLHGLSDRAEKPFVAVNCAAIAVERIVPELFGTVTGDARLKPGLLLLADGGTLFLDEVAQMPAPLQGALLRVLEDQRIRPEGAEREIPLNLGFLFATNADLDRAVAEGRFRADLYHRINVMRIEMPPLRERSEDIVELAALFMAQFSTALGMPGLALDEETLLKLRRYGWPGNVRELKNLVERSVILGAFPEEFAGHGAVTGARRLGVSRKTIDRKVAVWSEQGRLPRRVRGFAHHA